MRKDFYVVGLGLLIGNTKFTPQEIETLTWLTGEALKSNACFYDACVLAVEGTPRRYQIEALKDTLRALDKGPILEGHYDRAN